MTIRKLASVCCLIGLVAAVNTLADDVNREPAVRTESHSPIYPRNALQENREGWVLVDFEVDADGRVHNPTAIDSVGGSVFELAAVNSIGRRHYRPALLNGTAVYQGRNTAYVIFAINLRTRGSTKRFADRYNDTLELVAKNQLKRANVLASEKFDEWPLNLHELTKLWSLRAQLALIQGDLIGAETALRRATANNGEWLEKQSYRSLLLALVHVEIEIGKFKAAIENYDRLIQLNPRLTDSIEQTHALIESLRTLIASNRILETQGIIQGNDQCSSCADRWSFMPLRDRFTIIDVVGELHEVTMVCDGARVSTPYMNREDWVVPPQFGQCRVDIGGDAGTRFRVRQLPQP